MEAIVGRQYWDHWDKFGMRPVLQAAAFPEKGESMVLQDNFFRRESPARGHPCARMSDEDMAEYRRAVSPSPARGRRPTLTWPREIPIEGDPPPT